MAGLKICWTGYFDDFSAVSMPELQRSTTWAVESLFDLIGLDFAREGPKAPEFDAVFKMLGVQIDASEATTGVFAVGHTEDRKRELLKTFDDAIETGRITTKLAESRVAYAKSVTISSKFMETWYIFTDGTCEDGEDGSKVGGVGGVLISSNGQYLQHFGMTIPSEWMSYLLGHSKHPIHEIEVLPVLISFHVWKNFISNSQVLRYTDNDSCRYALREAREKRPLQNALSPRSWIRNTDCRQSLGTAVCRVTATLPTIQAEGPLKP